MTIEELLKKSVEKKASDLHILPGFQPLIRLDGELTDMTDARVISPEEVKQIMYALMTPDQQVLFEKKSILDMALIFADIGNFRVSLIHQIHGISAVFRVIADKVPTFEELSLPQVFRKLLGLSVALF